MTTQILNKYFPTDITRLILSCNLPDEDIVINRKKEYLDTLEEIFGKCNRLYPFISWIKDERRNMIFWSWSSLYILPLTKRYKEEREKERLIYGW